MPLSDRRSLEVIGETIARSLEADKKGVSQLSDLFCENPRLVITPNDDCDNGCLHCVADSTAKGTTIPYDAFKSIDPEFFKIFKTADFGRRGNPVLYRSQGSDLADMMGFLQSMGIQKFSIAAAIRNSYPEIIPRLKKVVEEKGIGLDTMLTYHHYFPALDQVKLAKDMNAAIKDYILFSDKIIISLLGDNYSQKDPTMKQEVEETFNRNHGLIFEGIELAAAGENAYAARFKDHHAKISIPATDTRVYPFGRFREYLRYRSMLNEYTEKFEASLSDYVCPDMIRWPGIIIEPDGGLNMCASFEAINCRKAVVSNILDWPFDKVKSDLIRCHELEKEWFDKNIDSIMDGSAMSCKMKKGCYDR